MITKKNFLLFGTSGRLGKYAIKFFLKEQYDKFYFFTRNEFELKSKNKNYEMIIVNDLSKEENVVEAFSKIKVEKDSSYFLLNTIGAYYGGKPISQIEYSSWQQMLDINLNVSFLIAKHFSKLVAQAKSGSICFISAQSSFVPESTRAAYNISKNALNYLVKTLSLEGKEINLSANAVAPYVIESPENLEWMSDKSLMVKPAEICKAVSSIFENKNVMSGNIIQLPFSI